MPAFHRTITFPCYVPRSERGTPELLNLHGFICGLLFTDYGCVEQFFSNGHRYEDGWSQMFPLKSPRHLAAYVRVVEPRCEAQGCRCVIVNYLSQHAWHASFPLLSALASAIAEPDEPTLDFYRKIF